MSKKIGILGVSLSLAVTASLFSNVVLMTELSETQKSLDLLTQNTDTNFNNVANEFKTINTNINGSINGDVSTLSTRMVEIEDKLTSLQTEFENLPEFVQLDIGEDVVLPSKPIEPEEEKPKPKPKPKPVVQQVQPTKENPEFITNTRLNFRTDSSINAKVNKTFNKGETLTWLELSVEKDGYNWIKVKDSKGNTGWVAQEFTVKSN